MTKFVIRSLLVVFISLVALVLNAEGKFLPSNPRLAMLMAILFIVGGVVLNSVALLRWRKQQTDQSSIASFDQMTADVQQRLIRKLRVWLIVMPIGYVIALLDASQLPWWGSILITAFAICAYSYVLFLYNRTKRLSISPRFPKV